MDAITAKTIDILGRAVKKTPLNSKLLSRPPFKFLHDLISELLGATGFAKGLFTPEELNAENVKDKESKIAFLTKIIKVVEGSTGIRVKANPAKIVAGMEAEQTNAFLQLLGKAAIKKIDASKAVQAVLQNAPIEKTGSVASMPSSSMDDLGSSTMNLNEAPAMKSAEDVAPQQSLVAKERPGTSRGTERAPISKDAQPKESQEELAPKETAVDREREPSEKDRATSGSSIKREASMPIKQVPQTATIQQSQSKDELVEETPKPRLRPTTARLAPPRIKQNVVATEEVVTTAAEDDDDDFVVVQDDGQLPIDLASGDHGALVRKMIDANLASKTEEGPSGSLDYKGETEAARIGVQRLTMAVVPLAKSMDLIQEDIDAMNRELENWRSQRSKLEDILQQESKDTGSNIKALEAHIRELHDRIQASVSHPLVANPKVATNRNLKATILDNETKISSLLMNVAQPMR